MEEAEALAGSTVHRCDRIHPSFCSLDRIQFKTAHYQIPAMEVEITDPHLEFGRIGGIIGAIGR
jgi:hypothetical protein